MDSKKNDDKIREMAEKWRRKYDNDNGLGCMKIIHEAMFDFIELEELLKGNK